MRAESQSRAPQKTIRDSLLLPRAKGHNRDNNKKPPKHTARTQIKENIYFNNFMYATPVAVTPTRWIIHFRLTFFSHDETRNSPSS